MEIESSNNEKAGFFARGWRWLKDLPEKSFAKIAEIAMQTKKIGQDDPRKVIHSLKVGLALTLVSFFFYFQPLYHNFGASALWAVMTVVVVFEFSVGATIGKGLNRGLATLLAGALGLGAQYLASMTGNVGEPILIALFVFIQAVISTFIRFFPNVKARYDYGLLIFILTFCFVSISGIRTHEILELAQKRLSTIFIGASACVIVSVFVYPVWAGEDLHDLVTNNIEKIGIFLEGFGEKYFRGSEDAELLFEKSFLVDYKSVLNSKNTEETLANFARWEPGHGEFLYRHPWKQYLKIGALTRQCACRIESLNSYLNSEIKAPEEICGMMQETCELMSKETGEALKELAIAIRTKTRPSSPNPHIINSKNAASNLKSLLKSNSWKAINLLEVIPIVAIASLLTDIVICVENIAESVNDLASLANFKSSDVSIASNSQILLGKELPKKQDCPHVIVPIHVTSPAKIEHKSSSQDSNLDTRKKYENV